MNNYIKKIERSTKTIIVTKQFLIAASQFGTPEFNLYMELTREYPNFTFAEYKITRNPDKQVYGKLTYEVMEEFIKGYEINEATREAVLKEYEIVKKISLTQKAAYAYVKKWFLAKYKDEFNRRRAELEAEQRAKNEARMLYVGD